MKKAREYSVSTLESGEVIRVFPTKAEAEMFVRSKLKEAKSEGKMTGYRVVKTK